MYKPLIVWFLCLQIILVCSRAFSETGKVSGYIFPPFVDQTGKQPVGLTLDPEHKAQLLISTKYDQIYQHTILIRKNAKPLVEEMNALLTEMENAGVLAKLWKKYGIAQNER